ncbi:ABC transporter substrate-binding protein [Amycolatopsis cihanbeyliensis]|uniref:Iron complex transport system substrate-binding protein n=1 Tax=Amycolatopsis cihanbeyliensis TaxID=1128664 RepID=A0A542DL20_AMYCI|nr:ABC transporter substrate-binding protein [Amycolatopsis cihanbeyliensis]TQJ03724.1 iron complex transport system substrate-binding protein [Amycolatopsis cihanbeyliensis]
MRSLNALSRRGFLTGVAALGASTALASCGYREDGGTEGTGAGTTWRYTDGRGRVLDGPRPERIVAQVAAAAALWEFGLRPVGIFGPSRLPDGSPDPEVGQVDLDTVTSLGNVWGEFNYDAYIELRPDLLVSIMYTEDSLWYVPEEQADQVEKAAPTVGVDVGFVSMLDGIAKFRELATALGADVDAEPVREARAGFEEVDARFEAAVDALGDQRVLLVSATQDNLYVGKAAGFPAAKHFTERGMTVVEPEQTTDGDYWEALSWENAGKYEADVILYDNRAENLQRTELAGFPTWNQLPAVQAGRITGWNPAVPFSYHSFASQLTSITDALGRMA